MAGRIVFAFYTGKLQRMHIIYIIIIHLQNMKVVFLVSICCSFLQIGLCLNADLVEKRFTKLEQNVQVCTITFLI